MPKNRELTESEIRAASAMLWSAVNFARKQAAAWALQKRRPSFDEYMMLAMWMQTCESRIMQVSEQQPDHSDRFGGFDDLIADFDKFSDRLRSMAVPT